MSELQVQFHRILTDEGVADDNVHSWRCFDKERYPEPCGCVEAIVSELLVAAESDKKAAVEAAEHRVHDDDEEVITATARNYLTTGYRDGREQTIDDCIAAVEGTPHTYWRGLAVCRALLDGDAANCNCARGDALAVLHSLKERP